MCIYCITHHDYTCTWLHTCIRNPPWPADDSIMAIEFEKYLYHRFAKEGPLWTVRPPPQFCLAFHLRSETSLKLLWKSTHQVQPSASVANREFPIVYLAPPPPPPLSDMAGLVYAHNKLQITMYTATWHDVMHYMCIFAPFCALGSAQYCYLECRPT